MGAANTISTDEKADVSIRRQFVPERLPNAVASGPTWEIAGDSFLLRVPRLARFLVTGGRTIEVALEDGAAERDTCGFLLGSAFGIILHQRSILVLHGSSVARAESAIVICGPSGSGKSTLAAALCRAGCSLTADDLSVIRFSGGNRPSVMSDGRMLKLWQDSIDQLDLEAHRGLPIRQSFQKYFIEPRQVSSARPRIAAIYVLHEARLATRVSIESLALPDAMRALEGQVYRPALRDKLGKRPEEFALLASLLGHVRAYFLTRAAGFEQMAETVAAVRTHWDTLE